MKPAERKKLKGIVARRRQKEAEALYFRILPCVIKIDRMIKKLMKEGHSKKEANEIVRKRIFGL